MKKTVILMFFALFVFVMPVFAQLRDDWKTRASTPEDDRIERAEHVKSLKGIGPSTDKDGRDWTTRPSTPEDDRIERAWHVYCLKSANCGGDPNRIEREWRAYLAKVANDPNCKKGLDGLCIDATAATNDKDAGPLTIWTLLVAKAVAGLKDILKDLKKGDPEAIEQVIKIIRGEPDPTSVIVKDAGKLIEKAKELEEKEKNKTAWAGFIKHSTDISEIDPRAQQTVIDCVSIIDPKAKVSFPSRPTKLVPGVGFVTTVSVHIEWSGNIPSPAAMECLKTGEPNAFVKQFDKRNYDRAIDEDRRRYEAWDRKNRAGNRD